MDFFAEAFVKEENDVQFPLCTPPLELTDHSRWVKPIEIKACDGNLFFSFFCESLQNKSEEGNASNYPIIEWDKNDCEICNFAFKNEKSLALHYKINHASMRPFTCMLCNASFTRKITLKQHLTIHSNSRNYVCDACGKAFKRKSTLTSHRKIHQKTKAYNCEVCNKGFHQKGNLKAHINVHTNAKPFKCPKCGDGFNQASNLKCHLRKKHTYDWCPKCGISFKTNVDGCICDFILIDD